MDALSKFVFLPGSHALLIFCLHPSLYTHFACKTTEHPRPKVSDLKHFSIDTVTIHSAHKSLASEHMTSMRHSFKLILEVTVFARPLHPPCIYKKVKLLRPAELPRRGSGKRSSLRETEILAKVSGRSSDLQSYLERTLYGLGPQIMARGGEGRKEGHTHRHTYHGAGISSDSLNFCNLEPWHVC